jgi:hypothetical protein
MLNLLNNCCSDGEGVMNLKGKMALACMFLVLVILWAYAPLVTADDEEDTVDVRYTRYNIQVILYDYDTYAKLTSITIPMSGIGPHVWIYIQNNSPKEIIVTSIKYVYIYSNGKKDVNNCPTSACLNWNGVDIPSGYTYIDNKYIGHWGKDVALGKGTFKIQVYGYVKGSGFPKYIYVKSYLLKLTLYIT